MIAGEDVRGRTDSRNRPIKEYPDGIGIGGAELNIVADHQHRITPAQQIAQDRGKLRLERRVHPLSRLVQQQNIRLRQQDLCQRHPLHLAAGQVKGMALQQMRYSA